MDLHVMTTDRTMALVSMVLYIADGVLLSECGVHRSYGTSAVLWNACYCMDAAY